MRFMRRPSALAAGLALVASSMTASGPAVAQARPGKGPDPIDQSRDLSTRPMPSLPAPEQPTQRLVPESRNRDSVTGRDVVVPPHYERSIPGQTSSPPPGALPPAGEPLPRIRGR